MLKKLNVMILLTGIFLVMSGCGSSLKGLKIELEEFGSTFDPNTKVEKVVYLQEFA